MKNAPLWIRWSTVLWAWAIIFPVQNARADQAMSEAAARSLFQQAGAAYDENNLSDAVRGYEQLVNAGFHAKELFFNLGNAYFRSGQPGKAVANYRRAWRLAPRDADIEANMRFAMEHTTAALPDTSLLTSWVYRASPSEWKRIAMVAYWAACLLGIAVVISTRWVDALKRAALACSMVAIVTLLSVAHWKMLDRKPEGVVIAKDQKALFAPLPGSTEHFPIPEGSIIRIVDEQGDWLEVRLNEKQGWLPMSACEKVRAL